MARNIPITELVAALRGDRATRPAVDPMLAGGLRAWLEDELAGIEGILGADVTLHLPTWRIAQPELPEDPEADQLALSVLVHALVAQHLAFGDVLDPLADAVDALDAGRAHEQLLERIGALDADATRLLADELASHDEVIAAGIGRIPTSWLPRSAVPVALDLCGGRVRASAMVDLLLGAPATTVSSTCLLDVVTQPIGDHHVVQLGSLALIETLRSGAAPLRVAALSTFTGDHLVLEVDDALLVGSLERMVEAAGRCARAEHPAESGSTVTRLHA
jgi:hypothetical protein